MNKTEKFIEKARLVHPNCFLNRIDLIHFCIIFMNFMRFFVPAFIQNNLNVFIFNIKNSLLCPPFTCSGCFPCWESDFLCGNIIGIK